MKSFKFLHLYGPEFETGHIVVVVSVALPQILKLAFAHAPERTWASHSNHSTRPSSVVLREYPEGIRSFPSEVGIARINIASVTSHEYLTM
jgi:hypothetical protein